MKPIKPRILIKSSLDFSIKARQISMGPVNVTRNKRFSSYGAEPVEIALNTDALVRSSAALTPARDSDGKIIMERPPLDFDDMFAGQFLENDLPGFMSDPDWIGRHMEMAESMQNASKLGAWHIAAGVLIAGGALAWNIYAKNEDWRREDERRAERKAEKERKDPTDPYGQSISGYEEDGIVAMDTNGNGVPDDLEGWILGSDFLTKSLIGAGQIGGTFAVEMNPGKQMRFGTTLQQGSNISRMSFNYLSPYF
ncbi:MAG: hypothetical protein ACX94D_01100 [Henriciella sp.]